MRICAPAMPHNHTSCITKRGLPSNELTDSLLSVLLRLLHLVVARSSHVDGVLVGEPVDFLMGVMADTFRLDDGEGSEEDADKEELAHHQSRGRCRSLVDHHVDGGAGGKQSREDGLWNGGSCRCGRIRLRRPLGAAGDRATGASASTSTRASAEALASLRCQNGRIAPKPARWGSTGSARSAGKGFRPRRKKQQHQSDDDDDAVGQKQKRMSFHGSCQRRAKRIHPLVQLLHDAKARRRRRSM